MRTWLLWLSSHQCWWNIWGQNLSLIEEEISLQSNFNIFFNLWSSILIIKIAAILGREHRLYFVFQEVMSSNELTLIYFSHKFYTCLTEKNTLFWNTNLRNCEMKRKQQEIWVWTKECCVNRHSEPCDSLWIMWIALNCANYSDSIGFTRNYVNRSKSYELLSTFDTIFTTYSRVLQFSSALSAFFLQKFDILSRKTSFENRSIRHTSVHQHVRSSTRRTSHIDFYHVNSQINTIRYGPYRKKSKK